VLRTSFQPCHVRRDVLVSGMEGRGTEYAPSPSHLQQRCGGSRPPIFFGFFQVAFHLRAVWMVVSAAWRVGANVRGRTVCGEGCLRCDKSSQAEGRAG
jgi:hypothetical protein